MCIHTCVRACARQQGESNSGAPERYAKCFPSKISQWRADFAVANDTFYVFAQIAPWPNHDNGVISGIRYAQVRRCCVARQPWLTACLGPNACRCGVA
jgi:hypothetical protein